MPYEMEFHAQYDCMDIGAREGNLACAVRRPKSFPSSVEVAGY